MTDKEFQAVTVAVCAILLLAFGIAGAVYAIFREIWQ